MPVPAGLDGRRGRVRRACSSSSGRDRCTARSRSIPAGGRDASRRRARDRRARPGPRRRSRTSGFVVAVLRAGRRRGRRGVPGRRRGRRGRRAAGSVRQPGSSRKTRSGLDLARIGAAEEVRADRQPRSLAPWRADDAGRRRAPATGRTALPFEKSWISRTDRRLLRRLRTGVERSVAQPVTAPVTFLIVDAARTSGPSAARDEQAAEVDTCRPPG